MVEFEEITEESGKRKLSIPRLLILATLILLVYFWKFRGAPEEITEHDEEESSWMSKRIEEIEKAKKEEADFQEDFQRSLNQSDKTELTMGKFRYKLFTKPRLAYKMAMSYCKDMGGRLPLVEKVETPRKLQQLIGKREEGKREYDYGYPDRRKAVWVGRVPVKKPKKKEKKPEDEEEGGYPNHMMDPMMMGGGGGGGRGEKMCPGLGPNSRFVPVECHSPIPFICEFPKNSERKPPPDAKKYRGRGYGRGPPMDHDYEPEHDEL